MPPRKPQQPNDPDSKTSTDEFLQLIPDAVRYAYRTYDGLFNKDDMEDLAQSVALLLLEGDSQALRSFEGRAAKKTWLQRVTDHHALRLFSKRKKTVSLEGASPDDFPYQQRQEKEALAKELEDLLDELADELPPRIRELLALLLQDLDTEEIAKRMRIKPDSVSKLKRRLFDKAKEFFKSKGWE